jgi:hypothetical protein
VSDEATVREALERVPETATWEDEGDTRKAVWTTVGADALAALDRLVEARDTAQRERDELAAWKHDWDANYVIVEAYDGMAARVERLEAALREIAAVDGPSGREIARAALSDVTPPPRGDPNICRNCNHDRDLHFRRNAYVLGKCDFQYDLCSCTHFEPGGTAAAVPEEKA